MGLEALRARTRASADWLTFGVGAPADIASPPVLLGDGPGWFALDAVDPEFVQRWWSASVERLGHRAAAGAHVSRWLTNHAISLVAAGIALGGAVPCVDAGNLVLHRTDSGWIDRVALRTTNAAAVAGVGRDGAAAVEGCDGLETIVADTIDPDMVLLSDRAELLRWCADQLLATLPPLVELVHQVAPAARRGQWAAGADTAAAVVVQLWRSGTIDGAAALGAWREVGVVFDHLVAAGMPAQTRPSVTCVDPPSERSPGWVRGVCCLYAALPMVAGQPDAARFCITCPIVARRGRPPALAPTRHLA